MKQLILILFLLGAVAYVYQTHHPAANPTPSKQVKKHQVLQGRVVGIKDGDTIELLTPDKETHNIRLAHVDTPERGQAFGKRAKEFTSDFCYQQRVSVTVTNKDRYQRLIGVVTLKGEELNLAIIKAGYGWHYKQYSKSNIHAAAETNARNKKLGLWSDKRAVAPWDYRAQKRAASNKK